MSSITAHHLDKPNFERICQNSMTASGKRSGVYIMMVKTIGAHSITANGKRSGVYKHELNTDCRRSS